jgi:AcrR family transcriptional regulator
MTVLSASGELHSTSSGESPPRSQVIEIQRSRLLLAAVCVVEELGYTHATVAHITRCAKVSRRTFYELFSNREECLLAVIEETLGELHEDLIASGVNNLPWRERVRTALLVILSRFDREPALARVCVVQALRGGPAVLERREQILARLADVIDEGRGEGPRGQECTPLTAEGLVGAAFTIVYTRLLRGEHESLTGLLGQLMAMIVLPYLGPAAARGEQTRPVTRSSSTQVAARLAGDPLEGLSMRMTYRTAKVLEGVSEHPGASNRELADHAEIHDQGQVSKLLARLQRLGLLANGGSGHAKGEPNAWTLTVKGERVAQSIRRHDRGERDA